MGFLFSSPEERSASLSTVIKLISNSWRQVDVQHKDGIQLERVSASFVLSSASTLGAELKIWIFKLGRKVDRSNTHKVTVELARPKGEKDEIAQDYASDLTNFLNNALRDFNKLNHDEILAELPNRQLTIEIGLTITRNGNIGGGYQLGIFTLSAEGGKKAEQGHTLSLVFSKKHKA